MRICAQNAIILRAVFPTFTNIFPHHFIATVNEEGKVAGGMADPKVCVTLDGTTIEEMTDEAARANLAGADIVEVRFDRMYLIKPDLTLSLIHI